MANFFKHVGTMVVLVYCLMHEMDSFVFNTWYMNSLLPLGGIYIGNYTESMRNCYPWTVGDGMNFESGPNMSEYCYYDYIDLFCYIWIKYILCNLLI